MVQSTEPVHEAVRERGAAPYDEHVTNDPSRAPLTYDAIAPFVGAAGPLALAAVVPSAPSTNTELGRAVAANPSQWPHMSVYVADHQTAGRGRSGRGWETPQGAALTASFLIWPGIPKSQWGMVPLAVGMAVVRALRASGVTARLKWPNDVVVVADEPLEGWGATRKVAGILCEARGEAVIAGIGINVSQSADELPVEHATSLAVEGARGLDRAALLGALAHELHAMCGMGEADLAVLHGQITEVMDTLGRDVVIDRPGVAPLTGRAVGLDPSGALVVAAAGGERHLVTAGDVKVRLAGDGQGRS